MIKGECRATAVGSFPQAEPAGALDMISEYLADIPVWPQLPNLSYNEGMCPQYSEGIPGVRIEASAKRIYVDTSCDFFGGIERFYEKYLSEDAGQFAISEDFAAGLHVFLKELPNKAGKSFAVKGHVTGPVTWGLTVPDNYKRATYYNDHLKDVIVKCIARKAQWQVEQLRKLNQNVIIFVDEPYLQSIGSSTISLQRDDVREKLDEVMAAIIDSGGVPGVHCCGNTDWSLMAATRVQILNYDAYEYGETIALYPNDIIAYIERGGNIAWGVVPASEKAMSENTDSIIMKFEAAVGGLVKQGCSKSFLTEQSFITPSCGVGSLPVSIAAHVMRLTSDVSAKLRG